MMYAVLAILIIMLGLRNTLLAVLARILLRRVETAEEAPLGFSSVVLDSGVSPKSYFGTYTYTEGLFGRSRSIDFYAPLYSCSLLKCYRLSDGWPLDTGVSNEFRNHIRHQEFVERMESANRAELIAAARKNPVKELKS